MKQVAINLPGGNTITNPVPNFQSPNDNLGAVLSGLFNITLYIAGFLVFYWFTWGVFQYIFAGGDKQKLAAARGRITWAIVGFLLLLVSFAVSEYAQTLFPTNFKTPTPISEPPPIP